MGRILDEVMVGVNPKKWPELIELPRQAVVKVLRSFWEMLEEGEYLIAGAVRAKLDVTL